MASCRLRVPAAEARKAGSARPRPPLFVGNVACVQLLSVKVMLRIFSRPVLSIASYLARLWCPAHGTVRRVYSSLGDSREILRTRRAWCREIFVSLLVRRLSLSCGCQAPLPALLPPLLLLLLLLLL